MCIGNRGKHRASGVEGPGRGPGSVYCLASRVSRRSPPAPYGDSLGTTRAASELLENWDSPSTAASVLEGPWRQALCACSGFFSSSGLFKGTVTLRLSDRDPVCVSVSHTQPVCTHEDVLERFLVWALLHFEIFCAVLFWLSNTLYCGPRSGFHDPDLPRLPRSSNQSRLVSGLPCSWCRSLGGVSVY